MTTAKWTISTGEQQDLRYPAAGFNEKGWLPVWGWRPSKGPQTQISTLFNNPSHVFLTLKLAGLNLSYPLTLWLPPSIRFLFTTPTSTFPLPTQHPSICWVVSSRKETSLVSTWYKALKVGPWLGQSSGVDPPSPPALHYM